MVESQSKAIAIISAVEKAALLWERQPKENSRAFHAFTVFRDLPSNNRTMRMVQDIIYPDSPWAARTIAKWAGEFRWVERTKAWEDEQDRMKLAAQADTIKTMAERHVKQAIALQDKGLAALEQITQSNISIADARLLIVEGAKLERLSRGQATEKVEEITKRGLPDLGQYSEEDLRRLEGLAKRVVEGASQTEPD